MVRYSSLDPRKSEIRLVTLLPGKPRDAIRCTLSIASLDSAPEFTALSYVWGDLSETKPITVDSEPFDVTMNLELCLRAIRKRWRRRVLWIDAICINQRDTQEKNVQVPQMGRLYSTAPVVLAWLGPSNPKIKLFVSWMRAHATRNYNAASLYWLTLNASSTLSKSAKREMDWSLVRAYEGYFDFLDLSYWGRVWTFQECLLPRIAPICVCGNIQPFPLTTVLGVFDLDDLFKLGEQAMERLETYYKEMKGKEWSMLAEFHHRRATKLHSVIYNPVMALPLLRNFPEKALVGLLFLTADRQCFDERDKIFALYGMVPAASDVYPPDYTKPITDVMLQAAVYIVNFEHLSHLLWSGFGLRDERLSDGSRLYPSWMPDWSARKFSKSLNIHVDANGRVAMPLTRSEDKSTCVSVEHTTLRFTARCLGTCRVVVRFADTTSNILEQIYGLLQMDVLEDDLGKSVRKPETLISRIARACVTHYSLLSDVSTKEILETFYLVFNSGPDALQDTSQKPCWNEILSGAELLIGKALLVTKDGCIGISVGGVEDDDVVVIPPGFEVPVVLTPESSTSADGVKYYKMVGTAIIDGVMSQGELFDENLVDEIAKRDVAEFLVH